MKGFKTNIYSIVGAAFSAASMMMLSSACGIINEDLDPCPDAAVNLRFVYEYNMEFANAFHNQVDCLSLYIYDEEGNFVTKQTELTRENLADENFRISLKLPEGNYRAIAYGGMECRDASFIHPTAFSNTNELADLTVALHPDCLSDDNLRKLHNHFYGSARFSVSQNTTIEARVEMMRNTNTVQVALQHVSGSPISHEDFNFSITDDNTLFDSDNNLLPNGEVTYLPFLSETRYAGTQPGEESSRADDDADNANDVSVAMAHFTTSRIVRNKPVRTTLTVTRKSDNSEVLRIPLVNYMLLFKSDSGLVEPMADQEYLDRENSWRFVFFLDDRNDTWLTTRIVINDWEVRINDTEF